MIEVVRNLDMRHPTGSVSKRKVRYVECKCLLCGKVFESRKDSLRGKVSCGCHLQVDIRGEKFNQMLVINDQGVKDKNSTGNPQRYVEAKCDCGKVVEVAYSSLKSGNTKSCGCYKSSIASKNMQLNRHNWTSHSQSRTKLYKVWTSMKQRCQNENEPFYYRYGGRGIQVCEEWQNFKSFSEWAHQSGYKEGLSIDRRDNEGNYEPSNCQWLTRSENSKKMKEDKRRKNCNE